MSKVKHEVDVLVGDTAMLYGGIEGTVVSIDGETATLDVDGEERQISLFDVVAVFDKKFENYKYRQGKRQTMSEANSKARKYITTTYETWDEESLEAGETDNKGWEDEEGEDFIPDQFDHEEGLTSVDLAADWLSDHGPLDCSSYPFETGSWYISYGDGFENRDSIENGTVTNKSYFLNGFTAEEEKAIYDKLKAWKMVSSKKASGRVVSEANSKARKFFRKVEAKAQKSDTPPQQTGKGHKNQMVDPEKSKGVNITQVPDNQKKPKKKPEEKLYSALVDGTEVATVMATGKKDAEARLTAVLSISKTQREFLRVWIHQGKKMKSDKKNGERSVTATESVDMQRWADSDLSTLIPTPVMPWELTFEEYEKEHDRLWKEFNSNEFYVNSYFNRYSSSVPHEWFQDSIKLYLNNTLKQNHYRSVRRAVSEGEDVPSAVLKEYPELTVTATESIRPEKGTPAWHQHKICKDTLQNPDKSLMGGVSPEEAEQTLRSKFRYSDAEIAELKESKVIHRRQRINESILRGRLFAVSEGSGESIVAQIKAITELDDIITLDKAIKAVQAAQPDGVARVMGDAAQGVLDAIEDKLKELTHNKEGEK